MNGKVIVCLLGLFGSSIAWGTNLLMEVGKLRAEVEYNTQRVEYLNKFHESEMIHVNKTIDIIMGVCHE